MNEMRALDDELTRDLQADGIEFALYEVKLATVTLTGADEFSGTPGTAGEPAYKVLSPRPEVDLKDQIRFRAGAPTLVGQALVVASHDACTREELTAAAWIEVVPDDLPGDTPAPRYRVNGGELRETWDKWQVVLQRL